MNMDGLANYNRVSGYVGGDIDNVWQPHTFAIDRGRKFSLDTIDEMDARLEAMTIMAEIQRLKINPEIDAYRFSKMVTLAGVDVAANLTYDTALIAIDNAVIRMNEDSVPMENRILYVSNTMYAKMKQAGDGFNLRMGKDIDRNINTFDGMQIVVVNSSVFKTAFDFNDGTTLGQTDGGFAAASGAKDINFMIVYTPAVIAIKKHFAPKFVNPEVNPDGDFYVFGFRLVHDLFIPTNKLPGVYVHTVA
jgi:hypothetical protein